LRRWRNRPEKYREAGRVDGKRGIPHLETEDVPEGLQQLGKFGDQELSDLAQKHSHNVWRVRSRRKALAEVLGADRKAHADAVHETDQRQKDRERSREAYSILHRKNPTYSGWWPQFCVLMFIALTVIAEYPLNLAAFSPLGENEYVTKMIALVVSVILMVLAHVLGAMFRSDNPAAVWVARFISAISLCLIIALSLMRKDTITQTAAVTFASVQVALLFTFYVSLQMLIFTLAIVIGYWLHEPMQHEFDKKTAAVQAGRKVERRAQMKAIATAALLEKTWDAECAEDHFYVHCDQEVRDRIEELRAIYLRSNRAARIDLEDGRLPKAYAKRLNLIEPQTLEDARNRINGRKQKGV
jgi:hypothetical protein